jgi:hypothetical protein
MTKSASFDSMYASRRTSGALHRHIATEELLVPLFAGGADQPAAPSRRSDLHRGRLRRAAAGRAGRPRRLVLVVTDGYLAIAVSPDPQA